MEKNLVDFFCDKKNVNFLRLWSAIGLFGADWSEKVRFCTHKFDFEDLRQHQLPNGGIAE